MDRRRFLVTSLAGALAAPLGADAQQAGKVHRIGVLSPDSPPPGLFEAFQERLRELGHIEGKNIAIESRHAGGKNERLPALADELIGLMVDVILAVNNPFHHLHDLGHEAGPQGKPLLNSATAGSTLGRRRAHHRGRRAARGEAVAEPHRGRRVARDVH